MAARCIHDFHRCALEPKRTGGGSSDGQQQEEVHLTKSRVQQHAVQLAWEFHRSTRQRAEKDLSG